MATLKEFKAPRDGVSAAIAGGDKHNHECLDEDRGCDNLVWVKLEDS